MCADYTEVVFDEMNNVKVKSSNERKLDFCWWMAAWDQYSIAAHVLDQVPLYAILTLVTYVHESCGSFLIHLR